MIEILEHGNPKRIKKRCKHCGCEISFIAADVDFSSYRDYNGNFNRINYRVICPDCKCSIEVGKEEVMQAWDNE